MMLFNIFSTKLTIVSLNCVTSQKIFKMLRKAEIFIFLSAIALIFVSEYYYVILKEHDRAIFIGLWPPTIIVTLIYFNLKKKN